MIVILPATLTLPRAPRGAEPRRPPGAGRGNRYSLASGSLFLAVIGVATIHTLNGGGDKILGLEDRPPRWPVPEFAVPDAAGKLEGDANVYQDDCGSSSLPCSEEPPRVPACKITTPGRSASATSSTSRW